MTVASHHLEAATVSHSHGLGLALQPGKVLELVGAPGCGLTRLGLHLLAPASRLGPVAALDARGWLSPLAAWEAGVAGERLVVVRCSQRGVWPQVMAAVCEGVTAVYAEVPQGVTERDLHRLAALVRARGTGVVLRPLRGELVGGVAHLRLRAVEVRWEGLEQGHGRLATRRLVVEVSGKGAGGMTRRVEVEDSGADTVRVVSRLGAGQTGRAVG